MASLQDFPKSTNVRRSIIDKLPEDVREQLVEARQSGSHSVKDMVKWLHENPDFGDEYRAVTAAALSQWFGRRGYGAGTL